jgi:hypothetical protein
MLSTQLKSLHGCMHAGVADRCEVLKEFMHHSMSTDVQDRQVWVGSQEGSMDHSMGRRCAEQS